MSEPASSSSANIKSLSMNTTFIQFEIRRCMIHGITKLTMSNQILLVVCAFGSDALIVSLSLSAWLEELIVK